MMLKRIDAGYHVDTIEFNCKLVNKFLDAQGLYQGQKTSSKKKKAKQSNTKNVRSLRAFWTWLAKISELTRSEDNTEKVVGKAPPIAFLSDGIYDILLKQDTHNDDGRPAEPYGFQVFNSPTRK